MEAVLDPSPDDFVVATETAVDDDSMVLLSRKGFLFADVDRTGRLFLTDTRTQESIAIAGEWQTPELIWHPENEMAVLVDSALDDDESPVVVVEKAMQLALWQFEKKAEGSHRVA